MKVGPTSLILISLVVGVFAGVGIMSITSAGSNRELSHVGRDLIRVDESEIRTSSLHFGSYSADKVVYVFSDYDCPFCKSHHETLMRIITHNPAITVAYYHLPIENLHPDSRKKAIFMECIADRQEAAVPYFHEFMFNNSWSALVDNELINTYISASGIDGSVLTSCVEFAESDNVTYSSVVDDDIEYALSIGARATPTNIINGKLVPGAVPPQLLMDYIGLN